MPLSDWLSKFLTFILYIIESHIVTNQITRHQYHIISKSTDLFLYLPTFSILGGNNTGEIRASSSINCCYDLTFLSYPLKPYLMVTTQNQPCVIIGQKPRWGGQCLLISMFTPNTACWTACAVFLNWWHRLKRWEWIAWR